MYLLDDSVKDTVPVATTSEIEVTTEPTTAVTTSANDYDLQSLLPGQWVGLPTKSIIPMFILLPGRYGRAWIRVIRS